MATLSRRHLLALGAVSVVAAGCAPVVQPSPSASPSLGQPDWRTLANSIDGVLSREGDPDYDTVRLTENPRFDDARPLAVLTASSAADVAVGVNFARQYAIPLAVRSGGHSYPGYSAGGAAGTGVKPSLVLDTRGMSDVDLRADNTVRVGAGASLVQVYSAIGSKGRAIAGGSCATVGITGLTLGGGVGVLVRAYGLTCDSLTEVEIVTADGTLHKATPSKDSDLFWASQGGGGGHLGIVTALTFATKPAPEVTMFSLRWPFASAAAVIAAWQSWAPGADPKLWSTLKLLNGRAYADGPGVTVSGTWLGAHADLPGQLTQFLASAGTPTHNTTVQHSYLDAMMSYAGCAGIPVADCTTGVGGKLTREAFAATSHVAYEPLNAAGIAVLLARVSGAKSVSGLREGGISLDALGGAVADVAADATAFPHRSALMTVQYTATFAPGTDSTPQDPSRFDGYVRGFRSALIPFWHDSAYVNYADPSLTSASRSYFGDNAARLRAIRSAVDPAGFWLQPQGY